MKRQSGGEKSANIEVNNSFIDAVVSVFGESILSSKIPRFNKLKMLELCRLLKKKYSTKTCQDIYNSWNKHLKLNNVAHSNSLSNEKIIKTSHQSRNLDHEAALCSTSSEKELSSDNSSHIKRGSFFLRGFTMPLLGERLNKEHLRSSLRDALTEARHGCVLIFKNIIYNKSENAYVVNAACKYDNHSQIFKFFLRSGCIVDMYTKGDDMKYHGETKVCAQLRGMKRQEMQVVLSSRKPKDVYLESYKNLDKELLIAGNTQHYATNSVIRNCRSEKLKVNDIVKRL